MGGRPEHTGQSIPADWPRPAAAGGRPRLEAGSGWRPAAAGGRQWLEAALRMSWRRRGELEGEWADASGRRPST